VLSVRGGWAYFVSDPVGVGSRPATPGPAIWRVRVTGGRAQLVQAGAAGYAISPDGRAVASVISADHGNVLEIVARNLVTGRQHTIVMATKPDPRANNWPPGITSLTWTPDDLHLAVQFSLTAAINSVLVFDAFTAATAAAGRTAPAPCTVSDVCAEFDPAYLASGALSYVIQRISPPRRCPGGPVRVAGRPAHGPALLLPRRGTLVLRHDRAGTGDLDRQPGPAEGAAADLALVRRRPGPDRGPPAAGRVSV
jgi:hypothetical protein